MFAILAEHASDHQTIGALIRSIASNPKIPVMGKGFNGGSELLKDGARDLRLFSRLKHCRAVIVCHDADDGDGAAAEKKIRERVIGPAKIEREVCALVPVREIESWLLADINGACRLFKQWRDIPEIHNPENIDDPKGRLEKICRDMNPKYNHAVFNPQFAARVDTEKLYARCPSFRPLRELVDKIVGIQRQDRHRRVK